MGGHQSRSGPWCSHIQSYNQQLILLLLFDGAFYFIYAANFSVYGTSLAA